MADYFLLETENIPSLPKLIIEPSDEVHFTYIPNTNIMSSIYINNDSNMKIMFRVRPPSDSYIIIPTFATIDPMNTRMIKVFMKSTRLSLNKRAKDILLIESLIYDSDNLDFMRNENFEGSSLKYLERHALKIKINILDSMKLNSSGYKKMEYASFEKEILFECTSLNRTNSFLNLNVETNLKSQKTENKNENFILNSNKFIDRGENKENALKKSNNISQGSLSYLNEPPGVPIVCKENQTMSQVLDINSKRNLNYEKSMSDIKKQTGIFTLENSPNLRKETKSPGVKNKTDDFIKKYESAFNKMNDLQNEIQKVQQNTMELNEEIKVAKKEFAKQNCHLGHGGDNFLNDSDNNFWILIFVSVLCLVVGSSLSPFK